MFIILLACALLLLLFFQLWKRPRRVRLIYYQDPQKETRKKAPKRPPKIEIIIVLKQREKLILRRGFGVRAFAPVRLSQAGDPDPVRFSAVKRKSYVNPGFPVAGAYIFI